MREQAREHRDIDQNDNAHADQKGRKACGQGDPTPRAPFIPDLVMIDGVSRPPPIKPAPSFVKKLGTADSA